MSSVFGLLLIFAACGGVAQASVGISSFNHPGFGRLGSEFLNVQLLNAPDIEVYDGDRLGMTDLSNLTNVARTDFHDGSGSEAIHIGYADAMSSFSTKIHKVGAGTTSNNYLVTRMEIRKAVAGPVKTGISPTPNGPFAIGGKFMLIEMNYWSAWWVGSILDKTKRGGVPIDGAIAINKQVEGSFYHVGRMQQCQIKSGRGGIFAPQGPGAGGSRYAN